MRIGVDTGVVIAPGDGRSKIDELCAGDEAQVVISAVSLFELLRLSYRRGRAEEGRAIVRELETNESVEIEAVSTDIAARAAGYSHSLALHASDALILATAVAASCDAFLTRDHHFEIANRQGIIKVEFL